VRQALAHCPKEDPTGLLFGDPQRFLVDLAMNLDVRATMAEFAQAVESSRGVIKSLRVFLSCLKPYQQRLGFNDAYGGPLHSGLNAPLARLGDPTIDAVLAEFNDWRDPERRAVVLPKLLDAADAWCRVKGVGLF